jgi:putative membrane protein
MGMTLSLMRRERSFALSLLSQPSFLLRQRQRQQGEKIMVRFLLRALVAALGLWVAHLLGQVRLTGTSTQVFETLFVAGALLGVVNGFVRPVVTLLTLPITIITLGLFLLVVNALMLLLVSWLVHAVGLSHMSFGGLIHAILATIIIWLVSLAANMFLGGDERPRRS